MPRPPSSLKHYTLQAGAGAGKTRHLIGQVFSTMEQHRKQYNQFPRLTATTFTKKAAYEVQKRIMTTAVSQNDWTLLNALFNPSQMLVSTLHGILYSFLQRYVFTFPVDFLNTEQIQFASRTITRSLFLENHSFFKLLRHYTFNELCEMLVQYDQNKRYKPQLQPLSSTEIQKDWMQYIHNLLKSLAPSDAILFKKIKEKPLDIQVEDISVLIKNNEWSSDIKKQLKNLEQNLEKHHPQHAPSMEENYLLFSQLAEKFQTQWALEKLNKKYIQIEDLELMTLENIRKHPSRISSFSKEWDYWFIDEYQDISSIQETLLHHLTQYAQRVWTVGDPQQSIYLFRKADPHVFERRKQFTHKEKGQFEEKNTNFRSEPELIEFFNDFFESHFRPIKPSKQVFNLKKTIAHFLTYQEPVQQNEVIAWRLNKLLAQYNSQGQTLPLHEVCLLSKTNNEVRSLFHFLKNLKFPVQVHSAHSLKREVMDTLFVLRFLIQPLDNTNLIGLLRTPYFHIPSQQIASLSTKNQNLWTTLKEELKQHPVVQSLSSLWHWHMQRATRKHWLFL